MADILINFDPKTFPPSHYIDRFRRFLEDYECGNVIKLLLLSKETSDKPHGFSVSCHTLISFDPSLGYSLIHHHELLLPLFTTALTTFQSDLVNEKAIPGGNVKKYATVRLTEFPVTSSLNKNTIEELRIEDDHTLIQVTGTIVKVSGVSMLESSKEYECLNPRCRFRFKVYADLEQDNMLPQIKNCPKLVRQEDNSFKKCNSSQIREVEDARVCVDYQEIKIQDSIEHLNVGSIPKTLLVILQADLVDRFNPGDEVIVIGSVIRRWRSVSKGNRSVVEVALLANNITSRSIDRIPIKSIAGNLIGDFQHYWNYYRQVKREIEGRDRIVNLVCPHLCGMFLLKLAVLLVLIGGSTQDLHGKIRRRSQIHLLMVGDPGCGKSQLLRFAARVLPRSILTTGVGTTGAGLTCAVVREGKQMSSWGEWSLEAGAMVLANGGICCIDEFSSIRDADRAAIHEAMEQQTVSIAKAGLTVKLNAQTAVIAASNPKGNYDINSDISVNTAIASPLLSRFDVVFVIIDQKSKVRDKKVSTYLLSRALREPNQVLATRDFDSSSGSSNVRWDFDTLKQYVLLVRDLFRPKMSLEARCLMMRYYQTQRQSEERSSARTTIRLLESLLRLSEAHAKLMYRDEVLIEDAVMSIACVAQMNHQNSVLSCNSEDYSEVGIVDPIERYRKYEDFIFQVMNYSKVKLANDVERMKSDTSDSQLNPKTAENHGYDHNLNATDVKLNNEQEASTKSTTKKRSFWDSMSEFTDD